MTRTLVGAVVAVMIPTFVGAQETKPARLADYVSFCLAVWENASDLPSKASALGLADATGSTGAVVSIGKSTFRVYKSAQTPAQVVTATSTTFADGKDWYCDIVVPKPIERADLEVLEKDMDLDGQIATFGPATMARWKLRQQHPPVLIKATGTKTLTLLIVQKYGPTPAGAHAKHAR